MDAACTIQDSIHVFSLVRKYVSRILGTYQIFETGFLQSEKWFYKGNTPTALRGYKGEL